MPGQRIVKIDRTLLADVLCLPAGTRIIDVSGQMYFDTDNIAFKIEHDDFDPVEPGQAIPEICPQFRRNPQTEFVTWHHESDNADLPIIKESNY